MAHAEGSTGSSDDHPEDGVEAQGGGRPTSAVEAAFDALPIATVLLRGPQFVGVAANAAFRALVGGRPVAGRPAAEVIPEVVGRDVLDMFDRVRATGQFERRRELWVGLDGGDHRADDHRHLKVSVSSVAATPGEVYDLLVQVEDVTDPATLDIAEPATTQSRHRFSEAREVISALQHALLPSDLPILPDVDIAAGYLLADSGSAAGGDWFDAIPLSQGRVALVVGDVVGHGIDGAAVMGGLRSVLNAALRHDNDLQAAMERLDHHAASVPAAHAATACVVVIDPRTHTLTYCTAGHPPPLVVNDQNAAFLAPSGSGPLATNGAIILEQAPLVPGDTVLLYSDGLVETPGSTPTRATLELARAAARAHRDQVPGDARAGRAMRACADTVQHLSGEAGFADDVTVLAAHIRNRPTPDIDVVLAAGPKAVLDARLETATLLELAGIPDLSAMSFHHGVGELVANAAEHASVGDPGNATSGPPGAHAVIGEGQIRLQVSLSPDAVLRAVVSDQGQWHSPEASHPGRGYGMVEQSADRVHIKRGSPSDPGTVVTFEVRAARPVLLLTTTPAPAGLPAERPFSVSVDDPLFANPEPAASDAAQPSTVSSVRVRVAGAVDLLSAEALRSSVLRAAARSHEVVLDMSEVTVLASGGVQVIAELASAPVTGPRLRLHAPPGSPAWHVLELVHLNVRRHPPGAEPRLP